ncbi:hypothetical protein [Nonomuraea ceibae]|uniref:hypothetical protein n=1 Tax=Nonomuraea ceibae TaxID=1935170 RepID=UPI001C5ED745|nr:hypothetical protein [Nonomuraea ceibae]
MPTGAQLLAWAEANPVLAIGAGVLALAAGALAVVLVVRLLRAAGRSGRTLVQKTHQRWGIEDLLTVAGAGIATGVSAQGMWRFAEDVLGLDGPLRLLLFAFIEIAVITSAVRARRNMREKFSAGIDGIAVWALTSLSAVLSAMDARSFPEAVFRLAAPLVAAWLWERGMQVERQRSGGSKRVAWRFTFSRLLVVLGLADPTDRNAGEMAVHRYITTVAKRAKQLRMLPEDATRKRRRALARLDRATDRAVEYARLADDPELVAKLMRQLAVMFGTADLAQVPVRSPWLPAPESRAKTVPVVIRQASRRLDVPAPQESTPAPAAPEVTVERTNDDDAQVARLLAALRAPAPALTGHGSLGAPSGVQASGRLRVNRSHDDPQTALMTGHGSPDAPTGDQGNGSGPGHAPAGDPAVTGHGSADDWGHDVQTSATRTVTTTVTAPPTPVIFREPAPVPSDDPTHAHGHHIEDDSSQADSVAAHVRATVAEMGVDLFTVTPKEIMTRFERAGIPAKLDTIRSSLRRERARVAETTPAPLTGSV